MKTRKKILLASIAVLACAYGLQTAFSGSAAVETRVLSEAPDSIRIDSGAGSSLVLSKDGARWTVGEKNYPADAVEVEALVKAVETMKILDSVSGGGDDERYGLVDGGLVVAATRGGKELRRISIGKASTTSLQTYVRIDGGKDVLLVSGNLKRTFDKKLDDLRDKVVFKFNPSELKAIGASGKANYLLAKSGSPESWKLASPAASTRLKPDAEKMDAWISGIAALRADGFAPETPIPAGKTVGELRFDLGSRTATLTVHEKGGDSKYLCSSSESPYPFYLSEYTVDRNFKPLEELMTR